jgi:heme exporter protein D
MSTGNATRAVRPSEVDEPLRIPPAMSCAECKAILRSMYFNLDGRPLCPKCSMIYRERIDRGTGPAAMGRAFLYGTGAAFASSIVLSIVLTFFGGIRIIAALGVAYVIAKAIDKATAGYGGRHYQILAVTLTYLALGLAMLMPVIRAANTLSNVKAPPKREARFGPAGEQAAIADEMNSVAAAPEEGEDPAVTEARADSIAQADSVRRLEQTKANLAAHDPNMSAAAKLTGGFSALIMAAFGLLVVLPIMSSFAYGLYTGAFSIFIFGYAMHKAWKLTELVTDYELSGPFKVGEGPIPPTIGV